jgi:hypothetical protein
MRLLPRWQDAASHRAIRTLRCAASLADTYRRTRIAIEAMGSQFPGRFANAPTSSLTA